MQSVKVCRGLMSLNFTLFLEIMDAIYLWEKDHPDWYHPKVQKHL